MRPLLAFLLLAFVAAAPSSATEPRFTGTFVQGGLVVGEVPPGTRVRLDGREVPVAESGHFLLGFGRDAGATSRLRLIAKDGTVSETTLRITAREYDIQRIDGLPPRQVTPSPEDLARIRREAAALAEARNVVSRHPAFLSGFEWPAPGRISGVYGSQRILNGEPRRPHLGVDIAAPEGTPVRAPADGKVVFVHDGMFFNGKTVVLDHGLGLISTYVHMSAIDVRPGQAVRQGTLLGRMGKTGRVTGPHLHWALRLGDLELDPELLMDGPPPAIP